MIILITFQRKNSNFGKRNPVSISWILWFWKHGLGKRCNPFRLVRSGLWVGFFSFCFAFSITYKIILIFLRMIQTHLTLHPLWYRIWWFQVCVHICTCRVHAGDLFSASLNADMARHPELPTYQPSDGDADAPQTLFGRRRKGYFKCRSLCRVWTL